MSFKSDIFIFLVLQKSEKNPCYHCGSQGKRAHKNVPSLWSTKYIYINMTKNKVTKILRLHASWLLQRQNDRLKQLSNAQSYYTWDGRGGERWGRGCGGVGGGGGCSRPGGGTGRRQRRQSRRKHRLFNKGRGGRLRIVMVEWWLAAWRFIHLLLRKIYVGENGKMGKKI